MADSTAIRQRASLRSTSASYAPQSTRVYAPRSPRGGSSPQTGAVRAVQPVADGSPGRHRAISGALGSLAALQSRRRQRSRRIEWALGAGALALALGACVVKPRLMPAAPAATADAPALSAPGVRAIAQAAQPTQVAAPAAPPIAFSFAKFEADPALVAGAASTGAPTLSGESGIVVDVNSREVLYAKNPHKRHLMASTAKIMTALVAVERAPLSKVITVPAEATQVEPNHMGLKAGEKLTLQELLYGLMLDSGNDAAETIAYGVGGGGAAGRAQFVTWMNEKARQLGLQNTSFANPAGLDDPQAYSTAYDLAVLGAHALRDQELRKVFGTKNHVIESSKEPGREHGWFGPGNLNGLLSTYRGAIGIKPGYTEDAGYTLVAAAERDGRTLVAVTLNSRRHFTDAALLLDFGFARGQ